MTNLTHAYRSENFTLLAVNKKRDMTDFSEFSLNLFTVFVFRTSLCELTYNINLKADIEFDITKLVIELLNNINIQKLLLLKYA